MKVGAIVNISVYITGMLCIIAVSGQIPFFYPILLLFMMALSVYLELKEFFIPRWLLTVFSTAVIAYFLLQIDMQDLIAQMMEALLILMGIKFLEQKQVRDYMQIYALALFVLAGLGLLTMSMLFLLYLFIFFFILSLSLIFLTFYTQDPQMELTGNTIKKILSKCLWIPLMAIPLSAIMFVILPRTHYPILTFLNRPDTAKTGFTDNVRLGQVSDIQEDESIIFRANMDKIDDDLVYWRGITLDNFDGSSWKSTGRKHHVRYISNRPAGKFIKQTIYLEPYQNSYVFALDKPIFIDLRRSRMNEDLTFTMPGPIERRIRYSAMSIVSNTIPGDNIDLQASTQLPANLSSRIISLAKGLRTKENKEATLQRIHRYLYSGNYKYSLKDLPRSKNPLEHFLFESRYGNCEYFASAMAVMLRVNGIPARLVGGYRGGYYNEMGKYYLVPQKNAHVWVEAHIAGKGWVRFDPTPASAEDFSLFSKGGIWLRLQVFFDTINYYWYGIILTYNLEKQISITRAFIAELKKPSLSISLPKGKTLQYILASVIGIGLIVLVWLLVKNAATREKRLLNEFLKKLATAGYTKKRSQGLEEFLSGISDEMLRESSFRFVREFEMIFYNDRQFSARDLKRLRDMIREIGKETGGYPHA